MADNITPAVPVGDDNTSVPTTIASTRSSKRKRAQVSYLNEDDELDELLDIHDEEDASQEAEILIDDDVTYGQKAPTRAMKAKVRNAKKAKTASTKAAKSSKTFAFMLLPAELRDMIYEMALTDSEGISLRCKTKNHRRTVARAIITDEKDLGDAYRGWGWRRRRRLNSQSEGRQGAAARNELVPALLAVNKQIHAEALGYLYQQPIILADTYALHSFLSVIGSNRSVVTDLTVKAWGSGRGTNNAMNTCVFPLLGLCTNLENLFLDCTLGWSRNATRLAQQIYRDGHHFFEAYGSANGSKDAAVDVLEIRDSNFQLNTVPDEDEFKTRFQAELRKLLGC